MNLLTVREVAQYLGTTEESVRRYLRRGQLSGANLGGRSGWRIKEEDIESFVRSRRNQNRREIN